MSRTKPRRPGTAAPTSRPTSGASSDHTTKSHRSFNNSSEREDVFFRRLSEALGAEATNGFHWSDLPMQFGLALKCAHIDHCLFGLHGVLEVLHANEAAREGGQSGLSGDLTDRMFYASRALVTSAKDQLYALQENIATAR